MTTTTTIDRVRNYQGDNSFVLKMKESLYKWGTLTPKQLSAVEKCLSNTVNEINPDSLPDDIKQIVNYDGDNSFVKDIMEKFKKYGTITEKQKSAALTQIQKEKRYTREWETFDETIQIGRKIGQELKEKYNLEFNPVLLDITKVLEVSLKAVKFSAKLTSKRGKVCLCCMRTLTDEFSMLTNFGKTCAKRVGVPYITDKSQAAEFRERYLKRVEEIGEMEFWIPKSQIKKWDGASEMVVMEWLKF